MCQKPLLQSPHFQAKTLRLPAWRDKHSHTPGWRPQLDIRPLEAQARAQTEAVSREER